MEEDGGGEGIVQGVTLLSHVLCPPTRGLLHGTAPPVDRPRIAHPQAGPLPLGSLASAGDIDPEETRACVLQTPVMALPGLKARRGRPRVG